ncbi:MAG: ABC transporter permease [Clostridia bacterium]|nr:ABC transporter permease [Clostridia bacterium]
MLHLLKYRLLSTMRDRTSMFWALAFPIILGTLFFFAFKGIGTDSLEPIPTAVVTEGETDTNFMTFLDQMQEGEESFITYEEMSSEEALEKLKAREVSGIYYVKEIPTLTVGGTGLEESILQSLLESYNRNASIIKNVLQHNPEALSKTMESMADYQNLVKDVSINGKEINGTFQYFLALIAMACLYGAFLGFTTALELKANLSALALRRSVTPTNRLKIIFIDLIVTFFIHFINIMILLGYLKYILKIDFGDDLGRTILVCFVGCLIGVALGIFVGSIGRMKEGGKIGVILIVTMGCSFGAGLMMADIKNL